MVLRIFKIIATSVLLTALKCAKFIFGPTGELTALPGPLAGLKGTASKGKGRERACERKRRGEGKGKSWTPPPPSQIPGSAPEIHPPIPP